jgi:hypothetical protein
VKTAPSGKAGGVNPPARSRTDRNDSPRRDLFVLSTYREGLPNALLEAMVHWGDVAGAFRGFRSLIGRPRPGFVAKYARSDIVRAMADEILTVRRAG